MIMTILLLNILKNHKKLKKAFKKLKKVKQLNKLTKKALRKLVMNKSNMRRMKATHNNQSKYKVNKCKLKRNLICKNQIIQVIFKVKIQKIIINLIDFNKILHFH